VTHEYGCNRFLRKLGSHARSEAVTARRTSLKLHVPKRCGIAFDIASLYDKCRATLVLIHTGQK